MESSTFTQWLLEEMKAREWSQAELARKSKVSESHLSHVLSGRRRPKIEFCNRVARAFDLPSEVVARKAGLLPPAKEKLDSLDKEWQHIMDQAQGQSERRQLIELARFELNRIKKARK